MLDTGTAMRRRLGAEPGVLRRSLRLAVRIEFISFSAGVILLVVMLLLLVQLNQEKTAWLTAFAGSGFPARYFAPANGGRRPANLFRFSLAWSGLALVGGALIGGFGLVGVALAFGLREWAALALVLAVKPSASQARQPPETPVTFREVAAITEARARHRLTYRVGKGLLGAVLGPLGGIAARTGRGVGMHRRSDRLTPKTLPGMVLLTFGTAGVAGVLLCLIREPASLVLSAALFRIAAAAANLLLWWRYASDAPSLYDDQDDDELEVDSLS